MTTVSVLDVSGHQFDGYVSGGPVKAGTPAPNLAVAKSLGIAGIFARVANGLVYDPWCELTLRAAADVGMDRGVYTYIQPGRSDPQEQAAAHLEMTRRAGTVTLPVMVDCEIFWNQDAFTEQEFAHWLRIYVDAIAQDMQRAPIKYSAKWWWDRESTGVFGELDCILARYPAQPSTKPSSQWQQPPADPTQWETWVFGKAPSGPQLIEGEDHWDGWQFSSWLIASDYGFQPGHRIDGNIVQPDAWARWTSRSLPEDDMAIRLLKCADDPAQHIAMCSGDVAFRAEWTGDGGNPKVAARVAAHVAAGMTDLACRKVDFANIALDGPLPPGWTPDDYANPDEIRARQAPTVDVAARDGVATLTTQVGKLDQELGLLKDDLASAGQRPGRTAGDSSAGEERRTRE